MNLTLLSTGIQLKLLNRWQMDICLNASSKEEFITSSFYLLMSKNRMSNQLHYFSFPFTFHPHYKYKNETMIILEYNGPNSSLLIAQDSGPIIIILQFPLISNLPGFLMKWLLINDIKGLKGIFTSILNWGYVLSWLFVRKWFQLQASISAWLNIYTK